MGPIYKYINLSSCYIIVKSHGYCIYSDIWKKYKYKNAIKIFFDINENWIIKKIIFSFIFRLKLFGVLYCLCNNITLTIHNYEVHKYK